MQAIKSKFWVVTASMGRGVHEEVPSVSAPLAKSRFLYMHG